MNEDEIKNKNQMDTEKIMFYVLCPYGCSAHSVAHISPRGLCVFVPRANRGHYEGEFCTAANIIVPAQPRTEKQTQLLPVTS